METAKLLVKALHAYSPQNNDELKLSKGDIITVTQKDEGGWWEGTLNGKTGWFPSNYVAGIADVEVEAETTVNTSSVSDTGAARRAEYKLLVLDDYIQSENAHILELQGMWERHLNPLRTANILPSADYETLVGNILDLVRFHASMLHQISTDRNKPTKEQSIGKIFLDSARRLETLHRTYCSTHPKAVTIIEKYKVELERFMESKGARSPGILVLIQGLSQPFRRLERYPTMLQEMERHVEESNFDKGNLQRAVEYYKLIDKRCSETRKQKEMELDIVNGDIKGWEGSDVNTLGAIQYINLVHVGAEQDPRYFVLFENTLVFLRYFAESNSLMYEGRLPVTGITLTDVNDTDEIANAFEIAGPMLEPIFVQCSSKDAKDSWITLLTNILKQNRLPSLGMSSHQSIGQLNPPVQAWNIACLHPSPPFNPFVNRPQKNKTKGSTTSYGKFDKGSVSSLNSRSILHNGDQRNSSAPSVRNEDDLQVLSIVDAFCPKRSVISNISTRSSLPQTRPSVSPRPVTGEKNPRNLMDIVMLLSDEMRSLRSTMGKMNHQLEEETMARKHLQHALESNAKSCKCSSCQ